MLFSNYPLVPQSSTLNRSGGDWYAMESEWASALRENKSVQVHITPNYTGSSARPDSFTVNYWIDGKHTINKMPNS